MALSISKNADGTWHNVATPNVSYMTRAEARRVPNAPTYSMTVASDGASAVTWVVNGNMHMVTEAHPDFERIVGALTLGHDPGTLKSGEDTFVEKTDSRVTKVDDQITFDGKPVHENLLNTIKRYAREGRSFDNLVRFLERVDANPSENSRRQLFDWAQSRDLTIDETGFIIAFKGVRQFGDHFEPINVGHGFVDSVEYCAPRQNRSAPVEYMNLRIGSVVTMPREECADDPNNECSTGLHIGTHSYATRYGDTLLEVRIDPADVVSVPHGSGSAKLRCCRYEVLRVHVAEGDVSEYEPEQAGVEEWDAFVAAVPRTFLDKLLHRRKEEI